MPITRITLLHDDGSTWYIDSPVDIRAIGLSLPKTIRWKKTGNLKDLHNKYFGMLSEMNKSIRTGYTDTDLHNNIKPLIFKKFKEFPQYFKTGAPECSTVNLNIEGWNAAIEQLKVVASEVFEYAF